MFDRIARALQAGREAVATPAAAPSVPASPPAGPAPAALAWALVHFGEAEGLTARLAAHRAFCQRRGLRCLLVADDIPQLCVTSREVRFEFVPWPARTAQSVPGGHAAAVDHSFRRLGRAFDFWQVIGCDWEGDRARDLLDLAPGWAHPAILAARSAAGNPSQAQAPVLP